MEENRDAWELYFALQSQWRVSGFGMVGLDYSQIWPVADVMEIEVTADVFRKIRLLEAEELKKQAEQTGKGPRNDKNNPGHKRRRPARKKP